jgi:YgiT-type zinc finger domain-containing protein
MKCVFCGGELVRDIVTFSYEHNETYIFIEHVPADVCCQCGERLYSPEVTDTLLRIAAQRIEPVKILQIPVYDFSRSVAC